MPEAKPTIEWKAWFASEDAGLAKDRLLATKHFATNAYGVADIGQDTIAELSSIKPSGKHKLKEPELREYLGSLSLEDLQAHVSAHARLLGNSQCGWDQKRKTGWRKTRTDAQQFTMAFDRFLKAFSGVVEIAKMADECYGGAATKILSVFYATVKIKADNDEAIVSAMETITDRLPDAHIYGQIYADELLAMMLADAYKDVIVFARAATAYFQGRGISRTLKSIKSPAKFPDMSEWLVKDFTNIRVRCEALLSQRVAHLAEQNTELLKQIKILTDGQNTDRVRRVQKLLDRRQSDSKRARDDHLSDYRQFLSLVATQSPGELSQMTLQKLQRLPEYQAWERTRSSLLFLHGCNHEDEAIPQSWLSLAVADLIAHLQKQLKPGGLVAYQMCSPEYTMESVMKGLISQILDLHPAVLSDADEQREIEHRISRNHAENYTGDPEHAPLDDYSWALRLIIDKCDAPVHIVISCPESCQGDDLWGLIKNLLRLVRDTKNIVKILTVVRTEFWNIEERLLSLDWDILDSSTLLVSRQDQTELEVEGY